MAKKKKKKGGSRKSSTFNTAKLIGMAAVVFGDKKFLDEQLGKYITDPKMKAAAKIIIGEYAPKQDFVKNFVKDTDTLNGGGDALIVRGMDELFTAMGVAGFGADDNTELAVAIEGVDDEDLDTVNDDEDEMNEDVLGDDEDLDTVNEDVLGDDEY